MVSRAQRETTKSKYIHPNSPGLLDSPQELGAGPCTFEVRQYSAYRFRLPPTPGTRLVQFKHDQQGQQRYGPQSTQTRLRHQEPCPVAIPISHHHFPVRSQISIHSILYSISHILEYKDNYKSRE